MAELKEFTDNIWQLSNHADSDEKHDESDYYGQELKNDCKGIGCVEVLCSQTCMLVPAFLARQFVERAGELKQRNEVEYPPHEAEQKAKPSEKSRDEIAEDAGQSEPTCCVEFPSEPTSALGNLRASEFGKTDNVNHPSCNGDDFKNAHRSADVMVVAYGLRQFFTFLAELHSTVGKLLRSIEYDSEQTIDGFSD